MKRKFNFLLIAALVCGMGVGVTSCSDDDSTSSGDLTSQITVSQELLEHGVEVDIKGGTADVTIDGKGTWMATIDDADWVGISQEQAVYTGKQTLTLRFDRNLTGAGRRTQLVIFDENGMETDIPVYQSPLLDGQEPSNSSSQWFSSKGLGHGVNYKYILDLNNQSDRLKSNGETNLITSQITQNDQLFNFSKIEELQKSKVLGSNAYFEAPIEIGDMTAVMNDEMVSKDKKLTATANIGIELGILNVSGEFHYSSTKKENRAKVDYNIIRRAPMYDVRIAPGEVAAYAWQYSVDHSKDDIEDQMDELIALEEKWKQANLKNPRVKKAELTSSQKRKMDEKWQALYALDFGDVFSMCFNRNYGELAYWEPMLTDSATTEAQKSEARKHCKEAMQKLDDYYGPFFLSGAEYGGSFNILCKVDTSFTNGQDSISGTITASLVGIGSLGGGIEYTSEGSELFRKNNTSFQVFGGEANVITSALFNLTHSASVTDYKQWSGVLNDWIDGMRSKEDSKYGDISSQSKAELLNFSMTPLWLMMPDNEVANFARAWFINKYWNKGILAYLRIMEGDEEYKDLQDFFDTYLRESKAKPSLGKYEEAVKGTSN